MKTIYKYKIEHPSISSDSFEIEMPKDSEILSLQTQYAEVCIWVLVDDKKSKEKRTFYVVGTGNWVPDNPSEFIGTFQLFGGAFVGHLFELIK